MNTPQFIAFYPTPVDPPLQSESEAQTLRELGCDAVILTPQSAECLPSPTDVDVGPVAQQARWALNQGLLPIFRVPASPFPAWMLQPQFAYRRWDGASHFGHQNMPSHKESVNVWHPLIKQQIIAMIRSLHAEVGKGWVSVGYGGCGELINSTYARPELPDAPHDLWMYDEISLHQFRVWYGEEPPRTYHEGDWRAADFLSRRMAAWVQEIALATPFQTYASPVIIHLNPWSNLLVSAGFAALPHWIDRTKQELIAHDKQLNIFFFSVYSSPSVESRLSYSLTANTYGWDVWVGGEGLAFPRNAARAARDGYRGLISRAKTLLEAPRSFVQSEIEQAKTFFN
jgi:hypothetical protein